MDLLVMATAHNLNECDCLIKLNSHAQGLTRVSLTGTFHDLLTKLRICCHGPPTTFIFENVKKMPN